MIAEYATYRYLRCVVNVMLLLSQLSVSSDKLLNQFYEPKPFDYGCRCVNFVAAILRDRMM